MIASRPQQVLLLLDAGAARGRVVEISTTLAQQLARSLEVVCLESAVALRAAALPLTQVLAEGGTRWQPFGPADVESGYQARWARLRAQVEQASRRHAVHWSMRVLRGALPQTVADLYGHSDLMVLGPSAPWSPAPARARRQPVVTLLADETPAGERARQLVQPLVAALSARLVVRPPAQGWPADSDLVVLPRSRATPELLARLAQEAQPALIVG